MNIYQADEALRAEFPVCFDDRVLISRRLKAIQAADEVLAQDNETASDCIVEMRQRLKFLKALLVSDKHFGF